MDINNFVINRIGRGTMFSTTTGEVLWNVTQVKDPQLSVTSDKKQAMDALDQPIMQFNRGKKATLSGTNSLFDLGLLAAQSGTTKSSSSASVTYLVPCWDQFTFTTGDTTKTLSQAPAGTGAAGISHLYVLNGDGTIKTKFAYGASASGTAFTWSSTTLTLPTSGIANGEEVLVYYEYTANGTEGSTAVKVTNTAVNFPSAGKFVLDVMGHDTCDISTEYHGFIIFPAALLSSDFDLTFNTETTHPFTIEAFQEYCDTAKTLFSVIVPEA